MTDVYCLNVTRVAYMTLYTTSFGNNGVQAYITAFGCTCYPLRCVRLFLIRQLRRVSKQQANFGKHGLILIILGKQHQHTLSAYSTFLVPSLLLNLLVLSIATTEMTRHRRLEAAPHSHMAHHKITPQRSCWSMEKAVMCEDERTSL